MRNSYTTNACGSCGKDSVPAGQNKTAGFITGALLVVLPKCPFCMLAYSSTIALCGKEGTVLRSSAHQSSLTIVITAVLCLAVLVSILFNKRDARTGYAFGLALAGSAALLYSTVYAGGATLYYSGVAMVFFGIWTNGSLYYVLRKLKSVFSKYAF